MNKITTNPEGRPLTFKTPEELQKKIDEYFDFCENRIKTIWDEKAQKEQVINYPAPFTMSGLARSLGIDRRTLIDYAHKDEFLLTVKAARERIHEDVETRLMEGRAQAGAIFNLKNNFGWKDESNVNQSGNIVLNVRLIRDERQRTIPTASGV